MISQPNFKVQNHTFMLWAVFRAGGKNYNRSQLEEAVQQLCHIAMQKTGGQKQYAKKGDLPFDELETLKTTILVKGIELVLSGELAALRTDDELPASPIPHRADYDMWSFLKAGGQQANIPALVDAVERLRKEVVLSAVDPLITYMEELEWRVICETVCLVLSGKLDKKRS